MRYGELATRKFCLLCLLGMCFLSSNSVFAEIIYHTEAKNTLGDFKLFLEGPIQIQNRAKIKATPGGIIATPSSKGGFTLYKFKDLNSDTFTLRVKFQIPEGIRYANSGVYMLYSDPRIPIRDELNPDVRNAYDTAISNAINRSSEYGAGPYEADYFAREIQIIAGYEPNLPADNHGPGAIYGIEPVPMGEERPGYQGHNPYNLEIGDTYEMTVVVRGKEVKTYLRSVAFQNIPVLVSRFVNVGRDVDPIRGGSPIALLLQAFPNNGEDVKSPTFLEIHFEEYASL